jgi:hypothetical protein
MAKMTDAEKDFLGFVTKQSKTIEQARKVEAKASYLTPADVDAAYKTKKDKDKWNEAARVVDARFGKTKIDPKTKKGGKRYVSISYVYTTGPLKGQRDSAFFNLEADGKQTRTINKEKVVVTSKMLWEDLFIALQYCGIDTTELTPADVVEVLKQITAAKPMVKIYCAKVKKTTKKPGDTLLYNIYRNISGALEETEEDDEDETDESAETESEDTEESEDGEADEEESDDADGEEESGEEESEDESESEEDETESEEEEESEEENGFYDNDEVKFTLKGSRTSIVGIIKQVHEKGDKRTYDIAEKKDKKKVHKGIPEERITLVKRAE